VFGEVIKGLEIVDKIAVIAADGRSRPKEDVKMTVTRIK
jgi:peptidyl-prolyl cis-trans isomerase B (cyclophilin B)